MALGSRRGGHVRHLIGDARPVPELDGDPERVDEALGCLDVVALIPVHLAHIADVDASGLSLAHLLRDRESLVVALDCPQVIATPPVHQAEVAGRVEQAAPAAARALRYAPCWYSAKVMRSSVFDRPWRSPRRSNSSAARVSQLTASAYDCVY